LHKMESILSLINRLKFHIVEVINWYLNWSID
jgi:hypothetical protein